MRRLNRIKETCLYVKDLKATREFYEGKLGLECFSEREGEFVFFRAGESVLLCFNPENRKKLSSLPPHWGEGRLHYAFECPGEDYGDWKAHAESQGVEILHEEIWREGVRSFYFHDPDGHLGEVVTPGLWDEGD